VIELRLSEAAADSIVDQAEYFRQTAGAERALAWESAVDETANSLLKLPERGTPCRFRSPMLAGVRWIFIPGFPKHMLFYRYVPDAPAILIVQVIHGARNLEAILEEGG
jgi:plasmid stabilization system protein ParE